MALLECREGVIKEEMYKPKMAEEKGSHVLVQDTFAQGLREGGNY